VSIASDSVHVAMDSVTDLTQKTYRLHFFNY